MASPSSGVVVRADAARTEVMPAVVRLPRWSRWRGTLPLPTVIERRPGSSSLPGRHPEPTPGLHPDPDQALLARVLDGLRAL
ncbi:hypothetical protein FHR84_000723 [Actinopolyspora biskrensis]|uniref:Uncharacterized protein n=1 Tax=Actinopolyspora biskrensis TaxID=1470178 RepID=A0A852YV08_9ACTN|nr:hypothetical protein [Actinopolyspora biskrensis]NYH77409.1 hypothetical protein [Actinopolyspora biskrensis]